MLYLDGPVLKLKLRSCLILGYVYFENVNRKRCVGMFKYGE